MILIIIISSVCVFVSFLIGYFRGFVVCSRTILRKIVGYMKSEKFKDNDINQFLKNITDYEISNTKIGKTDEGATPRVG